MFQFNDRLFSVCPVKVHHYVKTRHTLDRVMLEFYLWFLTCDRLSRSTAKNNAWSQNLYKRVITGIKMVVGRILLASFVNNDTNSKHNFDIHKKGCIQFYCFISIAKQKTSWVLMNHAAAASLAFFNFRWSHANSIHLLKLINFPTPECSLFSSTQHWRVLYRYNFNLLLTNWLCLTTK